MSTAGDDTGGGSEEITSNKKECTSCEQNNVDNITEGIESVVLDNMSTCACCGKEGNSNQMNICNKCKSVKYCNAACKKKHRTKHKKACERRVAELHEENKTRAAELYDEKLFKEIEREECPICMLSMPFESNTSVFKSCCGKRICLGCIYAMKMSKGGKDLCAFCREPPASSDKEEIERIKKLTEKGNGGSFHHLVGTYAQGLYGIPRNRAKANELLLKAGELGCARAYYNLGVSYYNGWGVEVERDKKKGKYFYELAAMGGNIPARYNLGLLEERAGNHHRALKHWKFAARAGHEDSLEAIKHGFMDGLVTNTKDEYASTLRAYQVIQDEMKSGERDKAASEMLD